MKVTKFLLGSVFILIVAGIAAIAATLFTMGQPLSIGRTIRWSIGYIAVLLIFSMALYDFSKLSKTVIKRVMGIGTLLGVLLFVSLGSYFAYSEKLRIEEQGVELTDYAPFSNSPNVATLSKPSTFDIGTNVPRLDGATALYPLYASFVQALYPEKAYDPFNDERNKVVSTTTGEAYDRLIEGETDIIFVAGPSDSQIAYAKQEGVEFNMTPIGREAFVFFVHEDNPVDSLDLKEIQDIYSGDIQNWKEVGGKNDAIRAFQRPEDSGSQTALQRLMGDQKLMDAPSEDVHEGMGGIIEQTASYRNHKNAIGFSFRFYATEMVGEHAIKLLQVNEVAPTVETIADETYPITSEFYAITTTEKYKQYKPFIEWMTSD